jgi:hypothetical protein
MKFLTTKEVSSYSVEIEELLPDIGAISAEDAKFLQEEFAVVVRTKTIMVEGDHKFLVWIENGKLLYEEYYDLLSSEIGDIPF